MPITAIWTRNVDIHVVQGTEGRREVKRHKQVSFSRFSETCQANAIHVGPQLLDETVGRLFRLAEGLTDAACQFRVIRIADRLVVAARDCRTITQHAAIDTSIYVIEIALVAFEVIGWRQQVELIGLRFGLIDY